LSTRGNRFAERVMTVAHTARKQGADVLEFFVGCCIARRDGSAAPSLFARSVSST
jgi:transposase